MKSRIVKRLSSLSLGLLSYPVAFQIGLSAVMAAPMKLRLPPPPQRGIAGNRAAAASRNACPIVAQPLTAIVPEYRSTQGNRVWGLTKMEHPTFWFYVPYAKPALVDISFTLQDESNPSEKKIVYRNSTIAATLTPGMTQITVPKSSLALTPDRPYHWFLELNMSCTNGQRPIFVQGWIQRVELDRNLSNQIDRATPTEQVALYAENGLWHDALNTLANLQIAKPQDSELTQDWQNLLDAIGLKDLADRPLDENRRVEQVRQLKSAGF